MKKRLKLVLIFALLTCSIKTMAQPARLQLDGHMIKTSQNVKMDQVPDSMTAPQIIHGVTMVPLRFVAESMCADVDYSHDVITLKYEKDILKLTLGSKTVLKNGQQTTDLVTPPLVKTGTTLVPLRFIAEAFGAKVDYKNGLVMVNTTPATYKGTPIHSLRSTISMTMGETVSEALSNKTIEKTMAQFDLSAARQTTQPANFTDVPAHAMDTDCCYLTSAYYTGLDASGRTLFKYEIYQLINHEKQADLPEWLLHDVKADQWYLYHKPENDPGLWKQISDTVI